MALPVLSAHNVILLILDTWKLLTSVYVCKGILNLTILAHYQATRHVLLQDITLTQVPANVSRYVVIQL